MLGTVSEIRSKSLATFSDGLLHMDTPDLADQQKITFIIFVRNTRYGLENLPRALADRDSCRERKRRFMESMLSPRFEDDDNDNDDAMLEYVKEELKNIRKNSNSVTWPESDFLQCFSCYNIPDSILPIDSKVERNLFTILAGCFVRFWL